VRYRRQRRTKGGAQIGEDGLLSLREADDLSIGDGTEGHKDEHKRDRLHKTLFLGSSKIRARSNMDFSRYCVGIISEKCR